MEALRKPLTFALFCILALALTSDAAPAPRRRGWELLGTRSVTDKVDHDSIAAGRQGTFRSLKIAVQRQPVQFRDVKIHFANGDVQHVKLRDVIRAGGTSRVIDVEGRDRVIRSIEFWYDAQSVRGKQATVRVFGKN